MHDDDADNNKSFDFVLKHHHSLHLCSLWKVCVSQEESSKKSFILTQLVSEGNPLAKAKTKPNQTKKLNNHAIYTTKTNGPW